MLPVTHGHVIDTPRYNRRRRYVTTRLHHDATAWRGVIGWLSAIYYTHYRYQLLEASRFGRDGMLRHVPRTENMLALRTAS